MLPMPLVVVVEEEDAAAPGVWRRGISIRILWEGAVFGFTADARALTFDGGAPVPFARKTILSPGWDPLEAQRSVRFGRAEHMTADPCPAVPRDVALDACRAVALRLYAFGVDRAAVTLPWAAGRPAFAAIVEGRRPWGGALPEVAPRSYPRRPGQGKRAERRRKAAAA